MSPRAVAPYIAALALIGLGFLVQRALQPPGAPASEVHIDAFWAAQLPDLEDRPQAMKQWRGKVLVVNFWAPWCPPCRREIPGFIALQKQYAARGLQFVGVALDEKKRVQAFVQEHGVNYPILLGDAAAIQLAQAVGSQGGLPYSVIFDRRGQSVHAITGEAPQDRLEALLRPLL